MNGDNTDTIDAEAQLANSDLDPDELDTELADDVDATIDQLAELIAVDSERQLSTPFGPMTEADLIGLIRPSLWQWVGSTRDTALKSLALIHRSTGDLLDKHAPDRDREELAREAIEET